MRKRRTRRKAYSWQELPSQLRQEIRKNGWGATPFDKDFLTARYYFDGDNRTGSLTSVCFPYFGAALGFTVTKTK